MTAKELLLNLSLWKERNKKAKTQYGTDIYTQNSYQSWCIRYTYKLLYWAVIIIILTISIIVLTI